MQVYFSHSYRDVAVNGYFIDKFANEDLPLRADQKTDIWCVAKLERYLSEMGGFISVIPCRPTDADLGGYSPYIGRELDLARRARVPRLLFVDERVLRHHQLEFPEDAVSFKADEPAEAAGQHDEAIRAFRLALETTVRPERQLSKEAIVVAAGTGTLRDAARDVVEILRRHNFRVTPLIGKFNDRGLDDIRLLEAIWRSELCIFLLGERLSDTHLALALAHAHCIPSIRLQHSPTADQCAPTISGTIHWRDRGEMLVELERQVSSYREGLVRPVEIAQGLGATDAARAIGTMRWRHRPENLWDVDDGGAILSHVRPDLAFIQDEVNRARRAYGASFANARGREAMMQICRHIYDGIRRHRFGFELEPKGPEPSVQIVRSPLQIETHRTANCLDLACLFASLIEAAGQAPIIVIVDGDGFAHALVGARGFSEPAWRNSQLGDLRRALSLGDALFFEPTGAVEADAPVADELEQDRCDKLLDFATARLAAERTIKRDDIRVRHVVDILYLRQRQS
ncbi:hypothetical protein J4G43_010640 [Bradyrhizobium barranii subsp. barranii]|uniref:Uncharacterized protein n=1 Tax=Bradyrhizobium barranii subsp. barranii TaxID=2823807 RepID=A0A939M2I5_9BRAD|nr:hypothetical protein [Bradyrhizobium barranii]UEM14654.1 hypothetical protein J4G43_010640 [Bradyrhizobium barranii subsp. barranii]